MSGYIGDLEIRFMTIPVQRGPWRVLSSQQTFSCPWFKVREDRVIQPDGNLGKYAVVEFPTPGVGIVAVTENEHVFLVEQYRYTHDQYQLEIPGGGSEENEDVLSAAKRELREETGMVADTWYHLGCIHPQSGATTEVFHLFIARRLSQVNREPDGNEQLTVTILPFRDALGKIVAGEIVDSPTIAALYRAWHYLRGI